MEKEPQIVRLGTARGPLPLARALLENGIESRTNGYECMVEDLAEPHAQRRCVARWETDANGRKQGKASLTLEGIKWASFRYDRDVLQGDCRMYDRSGQRIIECSFASGALVGVYKCYGIDKKGRRHLIQKSRMGERPEFKSYHLSEKEKGPVASHEKEDFRSYRNAQGDEEYTKRYIRVEEGKAGFWKEEIAQNRNKKSKNKPFV